MREHQPPTLEYAAPLKVSEIGRANSTFYAGMVFITVFILTFFFEGFVMSYLTTTTIVWAHIVLISFPFLTATFGAVLMYRRVIREDLRKQSAAK